MLNVEIILLILLKLKPILINANITGPLIGAIIGSLSAWILAYTTESYQFHKKKKGTYIIINSEFKNNIYNIRAHKIYHPLINYLDLRKKGRINDIDDFYKGLNDFPSFNHDNWDKFIDIIPDIFYEYEIRTLIEFNALLDKLSIQAKILSKNPPKFDEQDKYLELENINYDYYREISKDYEIFEKNFSEVLKKLDEVIEILDKKRFKLNKWFPI